jgi:membrane-associated protease RseP (regulator of RpoE activity)
MGYLLGVLAILIGVPLSIALHEIGHLLPAKKFGVKCTQYMIGFGPTLWSRRFGETEYGVKAIPLGGYVRMIGMFPPRQDRPGLASGRWTTMIEQARYEAGAEVGPDDGDRQFYQRTVPRRVLIMLGGPLMNLLVAVVILTGLVTLYGMAKETTTVGTVSQCVLPVDAPTSQACSPSDRQAPAAAAGLLPGDQIVRFDGQSVSSWKQIQSLIRSHGGQQVPVTVERAGKTVDLALSPITDKRLVLDENGLGVKGADGKYLTQEVGFAGISPKVDMVRQPVSAVPGVVWEQLSGTAGVVLNIPAKLVNVVEAVFGNTPRDPNGPISLIGVGRVAGEVASGQGIAAESDVSSRVVTLLGLVGSLNLALFVFNLVPLLPLDGGHVAGAIWEALRRGAARVLRRPDPGPVDTARALPLVYAVASVLIVMGGFLMIADVVKPIGTGL